MERDCENLSGGEMQMVAIARALVGSPGVTPREPGIPLTRRDIAAWLRATEGVKRIVLLQLRNADEQVTDKIEIARSGLLRWDDARSTIDALRPDPRRPR